MNERDFIYWLKGYLELSDATALTEKQLQIIKDHIDLVMQKKTPDRSKPAQQLPSHPPFFGPNEPVYCTTNTMTLGDNVVTGSKTLSGLNGLGYQVDPYIICNLTC